MMDLDAMNGWIPMTDGIQRRTLVSGPNMMQMMVRLECGSHLPEHRHPEEQIAHVISGRLRFQVAGEYHEVASGESLSLSSNIPHTVDVLETALVLDTFSPPREDLLAQDQEYTRSREQSGKSAVCSPA